MCEFSYEGEAIGRGAGRGTDELLLLTSLRGGQRVSVAELSAAESDQCELCFFYLVHRFHRRRPQQRSTCLHLHAASEKEQACQ